MTLGSEVSADLVDDLLSLPNREQQAGCLREAGLFDAEGLDRLLDVAHRLVVGDPGKARLLSELCADLAADAGAPAAVPRAYYVSAGAQGENGEFDAELRLTEAAYAEYVALGMNLEALRTNVGRMSALLGLGRYEEVLEAGQFVLDALGDTGEHEVTPTPRESGLLAALVHQNRSICYAHMGRYDQALEAYAAAEQRYRALGMAERLGEVSDNRGLILSYLGRGSEALSAHKTAADIFHEAGLGLAYAKALVNTGETLLRLADYTSSLNVFEQARHLLQSLDALTEEHFLLRNMADAYLALNLYAEALAAYREADGRLQNAGMVHDRAQVLWGMGSALIAGLEFNEAEEVLAEAAGLFREAGNAPLLSGVMLEQASLLAARGGQTAALAKARGALELVSKDNWPVQAIYAHLRLADLLLPDVTRAEPHLIEAQRLADRLALPQLRYRLNERFGRLRRLQGRDEEALLLLEAAVEEIERLRGTVTQDVMRASFLRDKTVAYEDLLRLYLAREGEVNVRRAFTVAERAKSRALVDLLTGFVEAGLEVEDSELGARIREMQSDLNATYGRLLNDRGESEGEVPVSELQARAVELEAEISRLRLQAAAIDATPNVFAQSTPFDAEDHLPRGTTLLAYHVVGDEVMAFVNAGGRVRVVRRLSTAEKTQRLLWKLGVQWDRFRVGGDFVVRHMALLEKATRQLLATLYSELVAPLEPLLEEVAASDDAGPVSKLAVVPHGPLHQVPFHALFDGERYLIERFEISYAPSATVYALCQERGQRGSGRALVFGVDDPLIPVATEEALAVAERLPNAEAYVGEAATAAVLHERAPGCQLLHLASHGMFRADNPMFSALKLHDEWLMAADVVDLDLGGALVTLSACESGRSEVIGGDEILGLTRAFLGAGAATLVVSLWLVQDETTATLMEGWYERLRKGEGQAAALRAAQIELKERYPHPYYWAPFVLIGKR